MLISIAFSVVLQNLSKIDTLTRADHTYLGENDHAYYVCEYTARQRADYSPCNSLIRNFNHDVKFRGPPPHRAWAYKQEAITKVAQAIARKISAELADNWTFIPTPPSKAPNDPGYDSRCLDCLLQMQTQSGMPIDVRPIVSQSQSSRSSHGNDDRLTPDELAALYEINDAHVDPAPRNIIVFDDLLVTGSHFKAMQRALIARFPGISVAGLFIARRRLEIVDAAV